MPLLQDLFSLSGKVALITGASGGIGRELASAFAQAGAKVALHGNSREKLSSAAEALRALGAEFDLFQADLCDASNASELAKRVFERFGRLDILVNCAGTNRRKTIREVTEEDFDFILNVNLKSVFFLSQAAHRIMKGQGGGKIVNIGSITSLTGLGGVSVYGATKGALAQLTKTMALEWAADNIQVNCLAPGFILTPLTEGSLWGDEYKRQWLLSRIPAGRPGKPADLAGAALLLAAPASAYLTGQTIAVDGGFLAGGSWLKPNE